MKIIYIPVVIPVNLRTFAALLGCLLASLLVLFASATRSWLLLEMRCSGISLNTHVSKIVAFQGLESVDVYSCTVSQHYAGDFCNPQHVVYTQCDDTRDPWCVGRLGFLGALAGGCIGGVFGLLSVGVGLVREMRHGIVAAVATASLILGLASYYGAYSASVRSGGLVSALLSTAEASSCKASYQLGFSFYCYLAATVLMLASAATSLSLRCCAAHGADNRALHPPTIQMMTIDTKSTTNIATIAPRPGFVQLENAPRYDVEEREEDDASLGIVTAVGPSSTGAGSESAHQPSHSPSTSPVRREFTEPPNASFGGTDQRNGSVVST